MRLFALGHFLALIVSLLLCSDVSPRGLALHRRALSSKSSRYVSLSKRVDGQSLYDKVQVKYLLMYPFDTSKESNYNQFYKKFDNNPNLSAPYNIQPVISSLPRVQVPADFTRIFNTCASLPLARAQDGECFDNTFSISSGIKIGDKNDRKYDRVPKGRATELVRYSFLQL